MKRKLLLLAFILATVSTFAQVFTTKTNWLGQWGFAPGIAHRPTNSIYIPGAYQFGDIDQFLRYNVLTDSWSVVAGLPAVKSEFGFSFNVNNRMFFGGGVDQPGTFTNVTLEFIPPNSFVPVDNIPNGPASGFSFSLGNYGYVARGIIAGFGNLNAMYRFDPAAAPGTQWSAVTAYPGSGNVNCGVVAAGGFAYAGFGRSNPGSTTFADFWRYDPTASAGGSWTAMAPFPGAVRECPILTNVCGNIILIGGGNLSINVFYNDIWQFDPSTGPIGSWTLLGTNNAVYGAQSGRYGPGFATYGDSLFFGMGYGVSNVNNDWRMFTYCPVILSESEISFHASPTEGSEIMLTWNCDKPGDIQHFELARSTDENSWTPIHFTDDFNNGVNEFKDGFPNPGMNYYRLVAIGKNGDRWGEAYTSLRMNSAITQPAVFPNPAMDQIQLRLDESSFPASYSLINSAGIEVMSGMLSDSGCMIPVNQIPDGIYFIRVSSRPGDYFTFIK